MTIAFLGGLQCPCSRGKLDIKTRRRITSVLVRSLSLSQRCISYYVDDYMFQL